MSDLPVLQGDVCRAEGCSRCCRETEMLLTEADVARLAGLGHDPAAFAEARDGWRVLRNRPWPGDPAGEERACVFLDAEGRCTVHADRPAGCRLYPLVFDLDEGPYLDDGTCPFTEAFAPRVGVAERAGLARLKATLLAERRARRGGGRNAPDTG